MDNEENYVFEREEFDSIFTKLKEAYGPYKDGYKIGKVKVTMDVEGQSISLKEGTKDERERIKCKIEDIVGGTLL